MKSPVLLRPRLTTQLLQLTYWTLGVSGGAVVVLFGSAFLGTTAAAATPVTVTSVNRPKVVAAVTTSQPRQPVAAAPPGSATGVPASLPPALTGGGGGDVWDRIAKCESSGKWNTDTGNGYHGGLQFSPSTWKAFGGLKYAKKASKATKAQQIEIAERVQAKQGWNAWPSCSRKAGMHGHDKYRPSQKEHSKKDDNKKHDSKKHDSGKKDHDKQDSGTITVRSGDTLAGLAKTHGIKNWRDLYEANRADIDNPGRIFVGQKLTLPKS